MTLEQELDPVTFVRTGRTRKRQFISYPSPKRPTAPIKPWPFA